MRLHRRVASTLVVALAAGATAAAAAPVAVTPPSIPPVISFGTTVACDPGTWSGAPVSYSYAWVFNGSTRATGPRLAVTDPYYRYGVPLTCVVTATDAAGAQASASSAGVFPSAGTTSLRILSVRVLSRGRIVVRGQVLPRTSVVGLLGARDQVVLTRTLGARANLQLSVPTPVDARGRFTVRGTDRAGRSRIAVTYTPDATQLWNQAFARRTVIVTRGGHEGV